MAYWRGPPDQFRHDESGGGEDREESKQSRSTDAEGAQFQWIRLKLNEPMGKGFEKSESGIVQIKIQIATVEEKMPSWNAFKNKMLPSGSMPLWSIRCFIFQCKDLKAIDADGASDPYMKIWNPDGAKCETLCIEDTINPLFYSVK